jgi:hypothetical protein
MLTWIIKKKKTHPKYPTEIQKEFLPICLNPLVLFCDVSDRRPAMIGSGPSGGEEQMAGAGIS